MHKRTTIIGTVICFVSDDTSGSPREFDLATIEGEHYLVASYLRLHTGSTPIPEQLIPMAKLPHQMLADGLARVTVIAPKELFGQVILPALRLEYGVVSAPELLALPTLGPIQ